MFLIFIPGFIFLNSTAKFKFFAWYTSWGFIFLYILALGLVIHQTAIDVPFWDGWEIFGPDGIQDGWSKNYLFKFQNEHKVLGTRLLFLINYHLFDLNYIYQITFNFLIYLVLLFFYWKFIGQKVNAGKSFFALIAFLPFISNLPSELHTWAFPIQYHLAILTFLIGSYLMFLKRSWPYFSIALACWVFSIFNFSGTILGISVLWFFLLIRSVLSKDKVLLIKTLISLMALSLALLFWSQGFGKNPGHPEFTFPFNLHFWHFFAELVSMGFGFTTPNRLVSYSCLALVLSSVFISLIILFKKR